MVSMWTTHTPWPNRAESAVRLFKKQLTILISAALADPILAETITAKQLVRQAAYARNISLTYGGVTPLELAFGRRPPDICDVENMNPEQLTSDIIAEDRDRSSSTSNNC